MIRAPADPAKSIRSAAAETSKEEISKKETSEKRQVKGADESAPFHAVYTGQNDEKLKP